MAKLLLNTKGAAVDARELNWGVTSVGRGPENAIVINHPSISYHHCDFELGMDFLVVRDRGSTNGTFINGVRTTEARLEPEQTILLGEVQMQVEWSLDTVSVPKISVPKQAASVDLGEGVMSCFKHELIPSTWHCVKCEKFLCTGCTRDVHLVGRPSKRHCAECSTPVQPTPWADGRKRKVSIWGRIKKALNRTSRV